MSESDNAVTSAGSKVPGDAAGTPGLAPAAAADVDAQHGAGPAVACCEQGKNIIDPELLSACIHCGLCLPACPTYLATGKETESPRGRIHLLALMQKGELAGDSHLLKHIDTCLGCMGCQTACPSGVNYEGILDQARPLLAENRPPATRALMRMAFSKLLPDYVKLHWMGKLLRMWQLTKLDSILDVVPPLKQLLGKLSEWRMFLPPVPPHRPLPKQAWRQGEKKAEVQLFAGCIMDVFYNDINHACIRLLTGQRNIVYVPEQTCCGALAFHAGEMDIATELAQANIELFERTKGDIIVTAAGCGAMLKNYHHLFANDSPWHERAVDFVARVKDITESLAQGKFVEAPKRMPGRVAYHAACHLAHVQKVREAPAALLAQLPEAEIVPLEEAEHCCGSAGIYNLIHTELSMKVLSRKMSCLKDTGASVYVTTNPGCLLQIQAGVKQENLNVRVCHLAEYLDEAYS
jgi:glycolate oxidase iron-sulfur subunit